MNEPMVIPALYAPANPNCATTCCVRCHIEPPRYGRHCATCAQALWDERSLEERREEMIDDAYQAARE